MFPLGEFRQSSVQMLLHCLHPALNYYSPPLAPMSLVPPNPDADAAKPQAGSADLCIPEHCFHAFDALYCALTSAEPIAPSFADDK